MIRRTPLVLSQLLQIAALSLCLGLFAGIHPIFAQNPSPNTASSTDAGAATPQTRQTQRRQPEPPQWQQQQWQQYRYQPYRRTWWDTLIYIFWWLLYSIWFWVLLAVFGLPYISVWLARRRRLKSFIRARTAELANPIDAGARFQLGSMLLKQKRYRRALPYLREAHQIQQQQDFLDPRLLDALADTLLALGQRDEAIDLYQKSLSLDTTGAQGEVFLQLGRAFQEKKQPEIAESWLQKACEANRSLAEPVYRLALHLRDQGQPEESRKLLVDFLKDAHALPTFIRKRNRKWVWLMRIFPLGRWLA